MAIGSGSTVSGLIGVCLHYVPWGCEVKWNGDKLFWKQFIFLIFISGHLKLNSWNGGSIMYFSNVFKKKQHLICFILEKAPSSGDWWVTMHVAVMIYCTLQWWHKIDREKFDFDSNNESFKISCNYKMVLKYFARGLNN